LLERGGAKARGAVRLFAVPGMAHCAGGQGCDTFDKLGAIDDWVEHGDPPERLVSSRVEDGKVVRRRPLCAYPAVARYRGAGDTRDAGSFGCVRE
ncbi:MAG TPA: tannase/feruloyl esterase family alpha/beta hydrolase, partial [Anaeromyxobacter sp.]|nr:tannase/feruloyl esterase family alpha/beta hydrolase [Anaeromyxobacter sp.]